MDVLNRVKQSRKMPHPIPTGLFADLIERVFRPSQKKHVNVCFSAMEPDAGVTRTVRLLAPELARTVEQDVLVIESPGAQGLCLERVNTIASMAKRIDKHVSILEAPPPSNTVSQPEVTAECMQALMALYPYLLLDCPPLSDSMEAAVFSAIAEGMVLVVGAGGTTEAQVERARQKIELCGGKLLGVVMNRRTYPIPHIVYRML